MEGQGADEGPLDQPGGPPQPVDPVWNPSAGVENYYQERLNQNLRRGGRGCLVPWILVASTAAASVVALVGR